ncbi:NUDIX hydrolase [Anaeromyxobacter oryzae]|uniref:Coenzyme A pyrophosphatase n=1 Tax=Anaeromyxobacter oryzae TaxID=2918170 RepID=A0ABM7WUN8_9BACT|nr:CoA pyrophosphatase [Anaeromyxobacter oryzae]BDG03217.1 coenzyme A pyrophosphatase [Anaeromyxobacter oryzae]
MPAPDFDLARTRIRIALAARPPVPLEVAGFRRAAVLVPLLARAGGPSLLFTRRAHTVPHHRGEISFPGGGLEAGEGPIQAALREAREEVGLPQEAVEVLGVLDDRPSVAGFVVTPVVAAVRTPPHAFVAQEGEVDEHFELPLARLLERDLRQASLWDPGRLPARLLEVVARAAIPFEDVDAASGHWRVWSFHADPARVVWGLTARILADLLDRAFPSPPGA